MDGTWKEKQYDYKNNKWNVIKCDIIRGFNYNRYRYVICIFLIFEFIALFNVEMHNKTNVFPGFLDNVFYILRGFQVLGDSENDLFLYRLSTIFSVNSLLVFLVKDIVDIKREITKIITTNNP